MIVPGDVRGKGAAAGQNQTARMFPSGPLFRFANRKLDQVQLMSFCVTGSERMRLPVAA
jgi:hypothetical protein